MIRFGRSRVGLASCSLMWLVALSGCPKPEYCDVPGDDDGNGLADCADPACKNTAACVASVENCENAGDEDHDGNADCDDSDCAAYPPCIREDAGQRADAGHDGGSARTDAAVAGDSGVAGDAAVTGDAAVAEDAALAGDAGSVTCPMGTADCAGGTPGCETDTRFNRQHCGACEIACIPGSDCVDSSCSCPVGETTCGTGAAAVCTSLSNDSAHCGSCDHACGATEVCLAGTCRVGSCPPGSTLCSGSCVTTGNDSLNCGACGVTCDAEETCTGGRCEPRGSDIGCADGTRDAFTDRTMFPNIAACGGGFTLPGVFPPPARSGVAACAHTGDDDTTNSAGTGCSSSDLCAPGWHVCRGGEIRSRTGGSGCSADRHFIDTPGSFYAASISSTGCYNCALASNPVVAGCTPVSCTRACQETPTLNNDIFGCGAQGVPLDAPQTTNCDGLDRSGNDNCASVPVGGWSCGGSSMESVTVTRTPTTTGACGSETCVGADICCSVPDISCAPNADLCTISGGTVLSAASCTPACGASEACCQLPDTVGCDRPATCSSMGGAPFTPPPAEGGVLCCR